MLMEVLSPVSAVATAILVLLSLVYYFMKNRDILPGPKGYPYLGLYPILTDEKCHLQLQEYGKKYGDLFSFTFCGRLFINLGSVKAMREVHVNKSDCFAGRFTDFNILTYCLKDGVSFVNGEPWKILRKHLVQATKEYGLTAIKDNTKDPLYDSLSQAIEDIRGYKGKPFNIIELLVEKCMAIIKKVIFGIDGVTDEDMRAMNDAYAVALDGMSGTKMLLVGPLGKLIYTTKPELRNALDKHEVLRNILYRVVKQIESSMDENHPTCVVEDFYRERNVKRKNNDPSWKHFSDTALVETLAQLVGDGVIAVAYFIGCFLHAIVKYPEEQEKVYKEVMEVVGTDRLPTVEDKSKMIYTTAFMNEVIRTSNFFTLFPSMGCTKETTVRGYRIPKGSITMLNIWQAHHDPDTFENPDKFDVSRYIASPGKPRAELPVQFGIGKRACSGEAFAMTQAFLYLTAVVKNFKISDLKNSASKSELFLMTGNMELNIEPRA